MRSLLSRQHAVPKDGGAYLSQSVYYSQVDIDYGRPRSGVHPIAGAARSMARAVAISRHTTVSGWEGRMPVDQSETFLDLTAFTPFGGTAPDHGAIGSLRIRRLRGMKVSFCLWLPCPPMLTESGCFHPDSVRLKVASTWRISRHEQGVSNFKSRIKRSRFLD